MAGELRQAISEGDRHLVLDLLRSGVSINKPFTDGMTPLNHALSSHQEDIAKSLIQHGAKLHQPDSFMVDECGRCPIHYAAACNLPGSVRRLIQGGVHVEEVDYGHSTALHHAASNGNLEIVQYLVERGCDIDHQCQSGKTAIWKALLTRQESVFHYLLKCGANINLQNKVGTSLLYDCIKLDLPRLCGELIGCGADPGLTDIEENNTLHFASSLGRTGVMQVLLGTGALDVNTHNEYGNTALHNSSLYNFTHATLLLLNSGADTNTLNRHGHSCLYLTMQRRQYECTRLLHDCGVVLSELEAVDYNHFLEKRMGIYCEKNEQFAEWALHYFNQPKTLFVLAIRAIRNSCSRTRLTEAVHSLDLPSKFREFILLSHYKALVM